MLAQRGEFAVAGGKHKNMKTDIAVDFTTICGPMRAGKPCAYCYVNTARDNGGLYQKTLIDRENYDGWVMRLRQAKVDKLNRDGGLRLFGSGDYLKEHKMDMRRLLDDCQEREIQCRALTKSLDFVRTFAAHPAIRVINLAIDALPPSMGRSPVGWCLAKKYKDKYPNVLIRAVATTPRDLKLFGNLSWVDIITLYHGAKTKHNFHPFTEEEHQAACAAYGEERICSTYLKCPDCKSKCGFPNQVKG
jgi:hypothetical protein